MYGGLFGDLPATKKDAATSEPPSQQPQNNKDPNDNVEPNGQLAQTRNVEVPTSGSIRMTGTKQLTGGTGSAAASKSSGSSSSIVRNLGTAGTSMAFVPLAARRRQQQQPKKSKIDKNNEDDKNNNSKHTTLPSSSLSSSSSPVDGNMQIVPNHRDDTVTEPPRDRNEAYQLKSEVLVDNKSMHDDVKNGKNFVPSLATDVVVSETCESKKDSLEQDLYNEETNSSEQTDTMSRIRQSSDGEVGLSQSCSNNDDELRRQQRFQEQVQEDPYDPMIPNDLLHYWEYKSMIQHREVLERERMETIRNQEALREKLKRDREELAQLIQRDDGAGVDDDNEACNYMVVEEEDDNNRTDASSKPTLTDQAIREYEQKRAQSIGIMGRGRGLSNLPAWMVQKLKKEKEDNVGGNSNVAGPSPD